MACDGNAAQTCGGAWANSLFYDSARLNPDLTKKTLRARAATAYTICSSVALHPAYLPPQFETNLLALLQVSRHNSLPLLVVRRPAWYWSASLVPS